MSNYVSRAETLAMMAKTSRELSEIEWVERELDRIDPWRHELGHDGATTRALYKLAIEQRDRIKKLEASS